MSTKRGLRKVFLSSTAKDLRAFRDALYKAIEGLGAYHCVRMEDFTSRPDDPLSYVRNLIAQCDLVVCLLGLCYGSCPRGHEASFTELEYDAAKQSNIPCRASVNRCVNAGQAASLSGWFGARTPLT